MAITRFDLCRPEKYIDKTGAEKTVWKNVGSLTQFTKDDGSVSRIVEIPAIGLKANVFAIKPKQPVAGGYQPPAPAPQNAEEGAIEYPEATVNVDDIPF